MVTAIASIEARFGSAPFVPPALIAWSAPAFRAESIAEVTRAAPGARATGEPVVRGHDLGDAYAVRGVALADLAPALRARAVFTRHVQPVEVAVPARTLAEAAERLRAVRCDLDPVRVDLTGLRRAHVRRVLRDSEPAPARRAGAAQGLALSALWAGGWLYLGASRPEDLLAAWPGGDPRFPPAPVSRAGAKLREALLYLDPPLAPGAQALDLGAAPGGFTSVLLERGARVLAIDPAPLHPALRALPALTCVRAYAADVAPEDIPRLDLLTCDIVTAPASTAALVGRFAARLEPGAPAIVTLKLRAKGAGAGLGALADLDSLFGPLLALERLRHLFANRCEVTAFLRRRASG